MRVRRPEQSARSQQGVLFIWVLEDPLSAPLWIASLTLILKTRDQDIQGEMPQLMCTSGSPIYLSVLVMRMYLRPF